MTNEPTIEKVKTARYKGKGRPKKSDYMTNGESEEILKKAIEKAIYNGLNDPDIKMYLSRLNSDVKFIDFDNLTRAVIFFHDFARNFWGEKGTGIMKTGMDGTPPKEIKEWHFHLQTMVLEEDPIKYLEQFL